MSISQAKWGFAFGGIGFSTCGARRGRIEIVVFLFLLKPYKLKYCET